MEWAFNWLKKEWRVIRDAPLTLLIAATLIFLGMRWWFSERIENAEKLQGQYREERDDLQKKVESLETRIKTGTDTPNEPTAHVQPVQVGINTGLPVIKPDQNTTLSVGITNFGPNIAHKTVSSIAFELFPAPSSPQEESAITTAFFEKLEAQVATAKFTDLGPQRGLNGMVGRTITKEEAEEIGSGKTRLYVGQLFKWTDTTGIHRGEACSFLGIPESAPPLWHTCESHNTTQ
jgi:hypothetical protein